MPKYAKHLCHDCLEEFGSDKLFICTVGGRMPHSILLCKECTEVKRHNSVIGKKAYKKNSKFMKEYFK